MVDACSTALVVSSGRRARRRRRRQPTPPRRRDGRGTDALPSRRAATTSMPCATRSVIVRVPGRPARARTACRGSGHRGGSPRRGGRGRHGPHAARSALGLAAAPALEVALAVEHAGVVERGVQQRLHLTPLVGRALADHLARLAVDQHEERRHRHVVVGPGRARHHRRDVERREALDAGDALLAGVLAHAHQAGVTGHLDRTAVAEHVPEREARPAAARQEREQREVLRADDGDADRVVLGGGADDVDRARATGASAPRPTGSWAHRPAVRRRRRRSRAGSMSTPRLCSARRISAWLRSSPATSSASSASTTASRHDQDRHRGNVSERVTPVPGRLGRGERSSRLRCRCAGRGARGGRWRRRGGSRSSSRA